MDMPRERLAQTATTLWWPRLSSVLWIVVACASLLCLVAAVPLKIRELETVAPRASVATGQLSMEDLAALSELGISQRGYALWSVGLSAVWVLVTFGLGVFMFARRGRHIEAYLLSMALVTIGLTTTVLASPLYEAGPIWANLLRVVQATGLATTIVGMLIFPDGRFEPGWMRWPAWVWVIYVFSAVLVPALRLRPGIIVESGRQAVLFAWTLLWLMIVVGVQVYRYRAIATPVQRIQMRWVIFGWMVVVAVTVIVTVPTLLLVFTGQPSAVVVVARLIAGTIIILAGLFLCMCYVIAILRYRLFDIDVVINRTLVYGGATAAIVAVYALIVGGLGAIFGAQSNPVVAFGAACVVAVLFQPVRTHIQRAVNRLMYGQRDEPYAVLAQFGRQLEATPALDTLLPTR
jgi:hypothetical protein